MSDHANASAPAHRPAAPQHPTSHAYRRGGAAPFPPSAGRGRGRGRRGRGRVGRAPSASRGGRGGLSWVRGQASGSGGGGGAALPGRSTWLRSRDAPSVGGDAAVGEGEGDGRRADEVAEETDGGSGGDNGNGGGEKQARSNAHQPDVDIVEDTEVSEDSRRNTAERSDAKDSPYPEGDQKLLVNDGPEDGGGAEVTNAASAVIQSQSVRRTHSGPILKGPTHSNRVWERPGAGDGTDSSDKGPIAGASAAGSSGVAASSSSLPPVAGSVRPPASSTSVSGMSRRGGKALVQNSWKRKRDDDGQGDGFEDKNGAKRSFQVGVAISNGTGRQEERVQGGGRDGKGRGSRLGRSGGRGRVGGRGRGALAAAGPIVKRIRLEGDTAAKSKAADSAEEGKGRPKQQSPDDNDAHTSEPTQAKALTDFAYRETSTHPSRGRSAPLYGIGRGGRGGGRDEGAQQQRNMGLVRVKAEETRAPICKTFARGLRCTDEFCTKRHDVPAECVTPLCSFFQRHGQCTRSETCPFRHVKVDPRAAVCPSFSLLGYCEDKDCLMRHVRK